jgi:hypothetical protein
MDARIATCAQLFGLSNALLPKSLAGLSQAEVLKPAGPQSTPMLWMAAHLAHARCGLLNMLGVDTQTPWEGRFGRGSNVSELSQYPAAADVLSLWKEIADQLQQRFETISSEERAAPSPRDFPIPDKSVGGAIHFLAFHEAYPVGQMAYLRKWLGKETLVG